MFKSSLILLLVLSMTDQLNAQTPDVRGAEDAVRSALDAASRHDWEKVVWHVHPDVLERAKADHIRETLALQRMRSEPQQQEPGMPAAVAKWFEQQRKQNEEFGRESMLSQLGINTVAEVQQLAPDEFAVRLLRANDPERMMMRAAARMQKNLPGKIAPERLGMPQPTHVIVGTILEKPDLGFVLYRTVFGAMPEGIQLAMMPVQKVATRWLLRPSPLQSLANGGAWSGGYGMFVSSEEAEVPDETAKRIAKWREQGEELGRAYLTGITKDSKLPKTLAIETRGADGKTNRIDLPRSAFFAIAELIGPWAIFADDQ